MHKTLDTHLPVWQHRLPASQKSTLFITCHYILIKHTTHTRTHTHPTCSHRFVSLSVYLLIMSVFFHLTLLIYIKKSLQKQVGAEIHTQFYSLLNLITYKWCRMNYNSPTLLKILSWRQSFLVHQFEVPLGKLPLCCSFSVPWIPL